MFLRLKHLRAILIESWHFALSIGKNKNTKLNVNHLNPVSHVVDYFR